VVELGALQLDFLFLMQCRLTVVWPPPGAAGQLRRPVPGPEGARLHRRGATLAGGGGFANLRPDFAPEGTVSRSTHG
jgi:hypothetical protein